MDINALKVEAKKKYEAAQAKWAEATKDGKAPTEDESKAINALLGEHDQIIARIQTADKLGLAGKLYTEGDPQAAPVAWRPAGPNEGTPPVDPAAWRELKVVLPTRLQGEVGRELRIRYNVPLAVQAKGYAPAFEGYLRSGFAEIGPADKKVLSEGVDAAGGFLVPEDYQAELIKKIATMATIRPNARVASTSRDMARWPRVVYTTDDKYTSGVRLTWAGEQPATSTVHRVTDPVFGLINVPVHTAMASLPLTNDLIEDSAFDLLGMSGELLAEAFALGENDAFINGSGVSRPRGILANVGGADEPASVTLGAGTVTADTTIDVAYALPAQYEARAKWFFTKATEKAIRKLKDTQNNYLWPVWPQGGNFMPAPRELLGFPVVLDEFVPELAATTNSIIFGDLSGYLILDRVGLSIQRLAELYAETNITLLLARKRVGGQVIEPWRVKIGRTT